MSSQYLRIFQQPKSAILLILGFASGLPLALTSGTLQAWMTVENIDLKTIGFFSLVGQAYVFKFLWSPVMDRYTPPLLGRRRGWLLITQALLLLAIAGMGFLDPSSQLRSARRRKILSLMPGKPTCCLQKSAGQARRSAFWAIGWECWYLVDWRSGWLTVISAGTACIGLWPR